MRKQRLRKLGNLSKVTSDEMSCTPHPQIKPLNFSIKVWFKDHLCCPEHSPIESESLRWERQSCSH